MTIKNGIVSFFHYATLASSLLYTTVFFEVFLLADNAITGLKESLAITNEQNGIWLTLFLLVREGIFGLRFALLPDLGRAHGTSLLGIVGLLLKLRGREQASKLSRKPPD